jgi:hypothetical protein
MKLDICDFLPMWCRETDNAARDRNPLGRWQRRGIPEQLVSRREHEHFAVIDLIFSKDFGTCFGIYRNFRIRKARSDRLDRLPSVSDGDQKQLLARRTICASAGPQGADLPTFCHGAI